MPTRNRQEGRGIEDPGGLRGPIQPVLLDGEDVVRRAIIPRDYIPIDTICPNLLHNCLYVLLLVVNWDDDSAPAGRVAHCGRYSFHAASLAVRRNFRSQ